MAGAPAGRNFPGMKMKPGNTRVLLRGATAGGITKADVERRARELALIRTGREDYNEADLEAAAVELLGDPSPATTGDDAVSEVAISRDLSEPRSVGGHQRVGNAGDPDENVEPERLVLQGADEAQHDLMVEAQRDGETTAAPPPAAKRARRRRAKVPPQPGDMK